MVFIEKEAKNCKNYSSPRVFTASARAAFTHLLNSKRQMFRASSVLLPSYIGLSQIEGSGVFDPVRKTGVGYSFYKVNRRLEPDIEDIRRQLKSGKFQIVFLIHYFGCPQVDVPEFVRLCHEYGVQVIEDCAHVYFGHRPEIMLGRYGDYAIFSIHKSTSTKDGGFFYDSVGDVINAPLAEEHKIPLGTLEAFARIDLREVSETALRNFRLVSELISEFSEVTPFFLDVPRNAVPLNCPVIVKNEKRERLYFSLIEHGIIPCALYHTLIPEIPQDPYQDSHFLSRNILNLPTHPDITEEDMISYSRILRDCIHKVFS